MPHPLVTQLVFTRSEFRRVLRGVSEQDAQRRVMPMNCISWNVGHLAWQEQRYFLIFAQGKTILPELNAEFANGAPASTPPLADMLKAWRKVTKAADVWLETVTSEILAQPANVPFRGWMPTYGSLLQRVLYHYWYHIGENMAIRQALRHTRLPQFVGDIDSKAPYRPE